MNRKVTARAGLTLSTGHTIPYGSTIGFGHPFQPFSPAPSTGLLKDSSQTPLSEFYPWRYSNLRSIPGEENKHQFVSIGLESVTFGNGIHACPGRFFASNEIKVVLVELLKRYDIGLGPNGEGEGVQGFKRPELLEYGMDYALDPAATIWVRNRKVA
jgi:gliotoxin biosynthesis cytochrome P450 monooxygenase